MKSNTTIAVPPILADPDKNNCAEQMHDSHPSGRIRPLNQSEVVRAVGCSCPDRPESGRLQYGCTPSHVRCTVVLHHVGILISSEVGSRERYWHSYFQMLPVPKCQSSSCPWEVLRAPISSFTLFCRINM